MEGEKMTCRQVGDIKKIADYYGLKSQINQTTEECGELIQALAKYNRCLAGDRKIEEREAVAKIAEELADVMVCVHQMMYILKIQNTVDAFVDFKILRQFARIEEMQNEID